MPELVARRRGGRGRTAVLAHVETWRPYTLFYAGFVSVAGALLAAGEPDPWRLVGAFAVATLGWIAALYGGDYFDRQLDAIAKPYRPIPSGRMSPRVALAGLVVSASLGAAIAVALNPVTLLVVAATAVLALSYSAIFKARGGLGNFVRGAPTALAFVFGTLATTATPPVELLPVALVFWLHDACSNIVGTLRDIDGDRSGGCATLAVRRGPRRAIWTALAICCTCFVLALAWPLLALDGIVLAGLLPLLAGAAALCCLSFAGLFAADSAAFRAAALRAHEILVVERLVLAAAFIAAAGPVMPAYALLTIASLATIVLQAALRARHELAPGDGEAAALDGAAITAFVDRALEQIASTPGALSSLASWPRRIDIVVADVGLSLRLLAQDGALRRIDGADAASDGLGTLRIETDSETFRDIFLTSRTNPRRAFLLGRIKIDASPRDLPRLNQMFNEFRRIGDAPPPAHFAVVGEAEPVPDAELALSPSIVFSDTTLRDGEQMPGVAFGIAEKVAIAHRLEALGIPIIEAGFPVVSRQEAAAVREIVALDLDAIIQVIARPIESDIDVAVATGAQSVALFIGTSDAHIESKLRTTRAALVAQVQRAIAYAKSSGCQVVFAAEDATRTPVDFLVEVYRAAAAAGADAVGIADTAGVAVPALMSRLVRQVSAATDVPVAVHCHDDLGLATANSLAGLLAGASGVQCSSLGIGERAGNAALEELVMALEIGYQYATGLRLAELPRLAACVSQAVGQPLPANKAVVGANAFVHESGLHLDGVIRDPRTYEPYPPEIVGLKRSFTFGKHSGRGAIVEILDKHDLGLDAERLGALVHEVKQRGQAKAPLDEAGLVRLAGELG